MAGTHVNPRVQRRREAPRAAGLRPVQIWVPDTRRPAFDEECRRQSLLGAQTEQTDPTLDPFRDEALTEVDDWNTGSKDLRVAVDCIEPRKSRIQKRRRASLLRNWPSSFWLPDLGSNQGPTD